MEKDKLGAWSKKFIRYGYYRDEIMHYENEDKFTETQIPDPQKDEYREIAWGLEKYGSLGH